MEKQWIYIPKSIDFGTKNQTFFIEITQNENKYFPPFNDNKNFIEYLESSLEEKHFKWS